MKELFYSGVMLQKDLEFCGIMTIRYKWNDNTDLYDQIGINSIRAAQYYIGACNEGALKNVFTASNVTEQWMGETSEDANEKVREYFLRKYGSAENVRRTLGYDIPATAKQMIPNSHYLIYGLWGYEGASQLIVAKTLPSALYTALAAALLLWPARKFHEYFEEALEQR